MSTYLIIGIIAVVVVMIVGSMMQNEYSCPCMRRGCPCMMQMRRESFQYGGDEDDPENEEEILYIRDLEEKLRKNHRPRKDEADEDAETTPSIRPDYIPQSMEAQPGFV